MARGDLTLFEEFSLKCLDGTHDLNTHTFKCALVSALPTASVATPQLSDFSEVSGAGYTAGGVTLTVTLNEVGGVATWDATNDPSWSQNASGPTNIVAAVIYNDTAAGDDAVCFIDLTTDGGSTAISLQDGDITISFNASGIFTLG